MRRLRSVIALIVAQIVVGERIGAEWIVKRDVPPFQFKREGGNTTYDWCDCGSGLGSVELVDVDAIVDVDTTVWFAPTSPESEVRWSCDGSQDTFTKKFSREFSNTTAWIELQVTSEKKGEGLFCGKRTGRLRWNTFVPSAELQSVPFVSRQNGYACLKIPVLMQTNAGSLLVFAEARKENCSDFAATDLVMRRSVDEGRTWSPLQIVADARHLDKGLCGHPLVVGNAAPVQLPATSARPNRILVPHTHNNFENWISYSDDDGHTFSEPKRIPNATVGGLDDIDCGRNLTYFGIDTPSSYAEWLKDLIYDSFNPYERWADALHGPWQFVGIGPPGSIVASSTSPDRVLVPGYHSYIRGLTTNGNGAGAEASVSQLYNNLALGHLLISDDAGDTFALSLALEESTRAVGFNENQLVELRNGSVLASTRTLSCGSKQVRAQCRSDDGGESWTPTRFVEELPEPFSGCEASVASSASNRSILWLSHPAPESARGIAPSLEKLLHGKVNLTGRDHLTVYRSDDQGSSWHPTKLVDEGASGYSALVADSNDAALWVFYEQSDKLAQTPTELGLEALIGSLTVLDPDRLVLRKIPLPLREV